MVTPQDIADWFLKKFQEEGGELTHLKLQKLLYYAQAWSLTLLDRPLFNQDFEAWAHGPALSVVWRKYRDYGWDPLPVPDEKPEFDDDTEKLLSEVFDVYGDFSAKKLERLTHQEAPWLIARGNRDPEVACNDKIPKVSMKAYYSKRLTH